METDLLVGNNVALAGAGVIVDTGSLGSEMLDFADGGGEV
jgi:hypothetical protein